MLIRSQDKRYLIDMNGIEIYVVGKEVRASRWVDHYDVIGEYSAESKAIKVLDMIQKEYTKHIFGIGGKDAITGEVFQPFGFVPNKSFQMPTDAELDEPTAETVIQDLMDM